MVIPIFYEKVTSYIVLLCPGPDKFAHVFVGMGIFMAFSFFLRKPFSSPGPILILVGFELLNEIMDRLAHGSWRWADTLGDFSATMFWPGVLFLALKLCPWLAPPRD